MSSASIREPRNRSAVSDTIGAKRRQVSAIAHGSRALRPQARSASRARPLPTRDNGAFVRRVCTARGGLGGVRQFLPKRAGSDFGPARRGVDAPARSREINLGSSGLPTNVVPPREEGPIDISEKGMPAYASCDPQAKWGGVRPSLRALSRRLRHVHRLVFPGGVAAVGGTPRRRAAPCRSPSGRPATS